MRRARLADRNANARAMVLHPAPGTQEAGEWAGPFATGRSGCANRGLTRLSLLHSQLRAGMRASPASIREGRARLFAGGMLRALLLLLQREQAAAFATAALEGAQSSGVAVRGPFSGERRCVRCRGVVSSHGGKWWDSERMTLRWSNPDNFLFAAEDIRENGGVKGGWERKLNSWTSGSADDRARACRKRGESRRGKTCRGIQPAPGAFA